jgi:hypothetical protein
MKIELDMNIESDVSKNKTLFHFNDNIFLPYNLHTWDALKHDIHSLIMQRNCLLAFGTHSKSIASWRTFFTKGVR